MATNSLTNDGGKIGRRGFLAGSAGLTFGIAFSSTLGVTLVSAESAAPAGQMQTGGWITIGTDNTVTLVTPSTEMGQGVFTSLPMLLAEEMDADWSRVRIVHAPNNPKIYGNPFFGGIQITGNSRSVSAYWPVIRMAGAQVRRVLVDSAAAQWKVPAAELTTQAGKVVHAKSKRSITYGDIAKFAKVPAQMPKLTEADLKKPSEWRIIGHDVARPDVAMKVNGTAKFGIDTQIPGMLYAAILRSPVLGNGPDKVDDAAAKKVKGVAAVIPLDFGVAVLGTNIWATKQAKELLKVTWKKGGKADGYDSDKILDEYAAIAKDYAGQKGLAIHQAGDLDGAFKGAAKKFAADYKTEHVYHATMEPMNTTAWVKKDEVEVWAPNQAPSIVAFVGAAITKLPPEKIKVNTTFLGGGFGRRLEQDVTADAIILSKITGKPVKVVWSREDDVTHDFYRPATAQRLEAAVDDKGKIVGWRHRIVAPVVLGRYDPHGFEALKGNDVAVTDGHQLTYQIPNQLHDYVRADRGVDVGFWRAVGPGYTLFAVETFIDELAANAGKDPVEYRLSMLTDPNARKVVEEAAKMAKWGEKRDGRALGIAYSFFSDYWNTHVAEIAEVSLNRDTGEIKVHKMWATVDPGIAVHPRNIVAQMESSIVFGVSHALREKITIKGGAVQESNFHDYPVMRMDEVPDIEVKVMANGSGKPGGIGEVGLPLTSPAIANAVAAMTGKRLRHLPFLPQTVKEALKA
jgi:isoquinoline 1-oxidoreductase beta subunit